MHRVTRVTPLDGYRLLVEFTDGVQGEIDLSNRLFGPTFEPLKDAKIFSQVGIDEFGAVFWPSGADLAPDALHESLSDQHPNRIN